VAIPAGLKAQILRYHGADEWSIGRIARQLSVHHSTVKRVLIEAGLRVSDTAQRRSQLDQYWPVIRDTLKQFPTLPASRLYRVAREHGYSGGPDHFRALIAIRRPPFDAFDWMLAVLQRRLTGKS
jgi:hypothetical protein